MKVLKLLMLLLILGGIFYTKFYYYDPAFNCNILIIPTFLPSNNNTKDILRMLKKGAPDDYMRVCRYVSVINKNPSCGGLDGGCFKPSKPRTIYIGNDQSNIAMAGAIVVHETCHAIQSIEGRGLNERDCYKSSHMYVKSVTQY